MSARKCGPARMGLAVRSVIPFSFLVKRFPCGWSLLSPRNTIAEFFDFTRF